MATNHTDRVRAAAREWMNTHHASFETNQERENALVAIISRHLEGEQGWLPISSAPQDGERILLANANDVWLGYWDRETEEEGGQCWRIEDGYAQRFEIVFGSEPTHWRSRPDPPEEGE